MRIIFILCFIYITSPIAWAENSKILNKYSSEINRVETYLNNITSFSASFVQVANDGSNSVGKLYLQRPNQMKWEYNFPSEIEIIVKGDKVIYFDKELDEVSRTSLKSSIFTFFTRNNISFTRDVIIKEVKKNKKIIEIIIQNPINVDEGLLVLKLNNSPMFLSGIDIVDTNGDITKVMLQDIKSDIVFDKKTFTIDRKFLNGKF